MKRKVKIALAAEVYERMLDGSSDTDIIEDLDITAQEFAIAKRFLLTNKGQAEASMSREERFARYLIQMEQNTADLTDLITNLNSKSQFNALVGAIRLRTDIAHKSIEMGQTLGVIEKAANVNIDLVAGVNIGELDDKTLRKGVVAAFSGLKALMKRHGDATPLLQLEPGDLHHGDTVEAIVVEATAVSGAPEMKEAAKGKRQKSRSGRRSAGRRRVKG